MAPRMWYSSRWASVAAAHPKRPQHWRFPARQADPGGIEDPSSIEKILTQVERKDAATIAAGLLPCRAPARGPSGSPETRATPAVAIPTRRHDSQCGVTLFARLYNAQARPAHKHHTASKGCWLERIAWVIPGWW